MTTTALAVAWMWPTIAPDRRVLVVDADLSGGDIASGYLRGAVTPSDGLLGLAGRRSQDLGDALWDHVIAMDGSGSRLLLTGISDPAQARGLSALWSPLAEAFGQLAEQEPPIDVLIDLGRLGSSSEARVLRDQADLVLLVLRSTLTSVSSARAAVRRLCEEREAIRPSVTPVGCLLVGDRRPHTSDEIAEALGLPVMSAIAWDPSTADVFSSGQPTTWRFPRSSLLRSARATVDAINLATHPVQEVVGHEVVDAQAARGTPND